MGTDSIGSGLSTAFRTAAWAALSSALSEIISNWDGALAGDNPDSVHDLRVGTRRLRAALSIYEAVMPAKEFRRAEKAVALLTDIFGPARDADVLIEYLSSVSQAYSKQNADEAPGVKSFQESIMKTRSDEQKKLDKALHTFDIDQLTSDINSARSHVS